jgi:hypothetical protein
MATLGAVSPSALMLDRICCVGIEGKGGQLVEIVRVVVERAVVGVGMKQGDN